MRNRNVGKTSAMAQRQNNVGKNVGNVYMLPTCRRSLREWFRGNVGKNVGKHDLTATPPWKGGGPQTVGVMRRYRQASNAGKIRYREVQYVR